MQICNANWRSENRTVQSPANWESQWQKEHADHFVLPEHGRAKHGAGGQVIARQLYPSRPNAVFVDDQGLPGFRHPTGAAFAILKNQTRVIYLCSIAYDAAQIAAFKIAKVQRSGFRFDQLHGAQHDRLQQLRQFPSCRDIQHRRLQSSHLFRPPLQVVLEGLDLRYVMQRYQSAEKAPSPVVKWGYAQINTETRPVAYGRQVSFGSSFCRVVASAQQIGP